MKVALITGATGEVGKGIAIKLLQTHFPIKIILCYRSLSKGLSYRDEILAACYKQPNADCCVDLLELDLSDMQNVQLQCEYVKASYERLDYVFLNAGVMPVDGMDLLTGCKNIVSRPGYVAKTGGDIIKQRVGKRNSYGWGEVVTSNVIGHYLMVKLLKPLLMSSGGCLLWCSSTTAIKEFLDYRDWQCVNGNHPYESSKRLLEMISIRLDEELCKDGIRSYLYSPGNVLSGITQGMVHPLLFLFALYVMRFLGCSGVNITGENAATAPVSFANRPDTENLPADVLYHSEIGIFGNTSVRAMKIDYDENDLRQTKEVLKEMDRMVGDYLQE